MAIDDEVRKLYERYQAAESDEERYAEIYDALEDE